MNGLKKDASEQEMRQYFCEKAKRIVIKIGSAVLTDEFGINRKVVENLADGIAALHDKGIEVILVSSGAVAAGLRQLNFTPEIIHSIKEKQALAAVGQSCLMENYDHAFARHDKKIAQVLLTHSDLSIRERYLNVRNTILTLFRFNVIPIINENDTVSVEELRFGDNDNLGALVANLTDADMFICLTDIDALYSGNPLKNPDAAPVHTVVEITDEIKAMVGNVKSKLGTGGMMSKINAVSKMASGGGASFIGSGSEEKLLQRLFDGEMLGTFFLPRKDKINRRKQWIAHVLKPQGIIIVDAGAKKALTRYGKSLLPSGIIQVSGDFSVGDAVECQDSNGFTFGIGLTNYKASDVDLIKGRKTTEVANLIDNKDSDEVIHRDNLVIM